MGADLQEFQEKLISKPLLPKFSKELLNLRKIQQHLARQKDYAEAHKMKLKADSLEGWELEKQQNERQQQMFKKEAAFKHKQGQERKALKKRITSGRETRKRQRQFDL